MRRSLFATVLATSLACSPEPDRSASLRPAAAPLLTVFLIDGLAQEVFERELAAGNLPHLKGMVDAGAWVKNGVAAFPTITGYGYWPFLTGEDATSSGVLGVRWLDRGREVGAFRNYVGRTHVHLNSDLNAHPPTLFERFSTQYTSSFNNSVSRGAGRSVFGGWQFSMAKYREVWWLPKLITPLGMAPTWAEAEGEIVDLAIAELPRRPKVQWIVFASPDGHGHLRGLDAGYAEVVRMLDGLIGRYRAASQAQGQEGERLYAVITDHGVADVSRNLDLCVELRRAVGLDLWRGDSTDLWSDELDDPLDTFAEHDGVLAVNGNTMNYIYLKRDGRFARPLRGHELRRYAAGVGTIDLLAALRAVPGVELVVARGERDEVLVLGAEGEGRVRRSSDGLAYTVHGGDPLRHGAAALPLMDGAPHSRAAWLDASIASPFPYSVPRLAALMAQHDAGDIVVTASPGVDLAADYELVVGNYRGGHGGLRADQLRVPYLLAGPGVRRGVTIDAATAEDFGVTLLHLLGVEVSTQGRVLGEALE